MANQIKVALLIPYFGKWPSYFGLFLDSCRQNPEIDVLFFTDCPIPATPPPNVFFWPSNLAAINELAETKLGHQVTIKFPYKLCDLRPFYGLVFADYLGGYDYWGFGDIDVIWGTLEPFVTEPLQANYDTISMRAEYLSGSFCLLKNSPFINTLWQHSRDWEKVLTTPEYLGFDECGGVAHRLLAKGVSLMDVPRPIDSLSYVVGKLRQDRRLKPHFVTNVKEGLGAKEVAIYEQGKIRDLTGQQFAYYHLVCEKSLPSFGWVDWETLPDKFYITRTGFYSSQKFRFYCLIAGWRKLKGALKYILILAPRELSRRKQQEAQRHDGKKVTILLWGKILWAICARKLRLRQI